MKTSQKNEFFDNNLEKIFKASTNDQIDFVREVIELVEVQNEMKKWPSAIKELVVDRYLKNKQ